MTQSEITNAISMLGSRIERTETAISDLGGQCLTAHWIGGGQRIFWSLGEVKDWICDHAS